MFARTVAEPEDGTGRDEYFPGLPASHPNLEPTVSVTPVVVKSKSRIHPFNADP